MGMQSSFLLSSYYCSYSPESVMSDVINDFGACVLKVLNTKTENVAFSPYGLVSVALVLYEGANGETAAEIHNALRLPWDRDVTRIGFRDIHRYLRSYFTNDGFLRGLVLSKPNVVLNRNYSTQLQFYGFDFHSEQPDKSTSTPPRGSTTPTPFTIVFSTTTKTTYAPPPTPTTNAQTTDGTMDSSTLSDRTTGIYSPDMPSTNIEGKDMEVDLPGTSKPDVPSTTIRSLAGIPMSTLPVTETSENSATESKATTEDEILATTINLTVTMINVTKRYTPRPTISMSSTDAASSSTSSVIITTIAQDTTTATPRTAASLLTTITTPLPATTMPLPTTTTPLPATTTPLITTTTPLLTTTTPIQTTTTPSPTTTPESTTILPQSTTTATQSPPPSPEPTATLASSTSTTTEAATITAAVAVSEATSQQPSLADEITSTTMPQLNDETTQIPSAMETDNVASESEMVTRIERALHPRGYGAEHREGIPNSLPHYQDPRWGLRDSNENWFFTPSGGERVPIITYTGYLPFAYIPDLGSLILQVPLDDPRYFMLIMLPEERDGLDKLLYALQWCPLRAIVSELQTTAIYAIIPSFTVVKHINLTPALSQVGIVRAFDGLKSDLSVMSSEPGLYVRSIEQVVTVSLRKYFANHRWFEATPSHIEHHFIANHPFAYFVLDKETEVALMTGTIINPVAKN